MSRLCRASGLKTVNGGRFGISIARTIAYYAANFCHGRYFGGWRSSLVSCVFGGNDKKNQAGGISVRGDFNAVRLRDFIANAR